MLFRRLLGCTLIVFGGVLAFDRLARGLDPVPRLLGGIAVAIPALGLAVLAGLTATRLARALDLSPAAVYGLAAALPAPNLIVVARFGAHMVSGWAAAGLSPLALLLPRRVIEERAPRRSVVPPASALGFIATFLLVFAFVGGIGAVADLISAKPGPSTDTARSSPVTPPRPTPDSGFYRPFAALGQAAFQEADARLSRLDGEAVALGNAPAGTRVADRIGEVMAREVRESLAAYPAFRPAVDAGRIRVYVHARPERASVLMQVPRFETLDDTTRTALLDFGWRATTREARSLRLTGSRRVALALRGSGAYSAVAWGDLTDQETRQNDVRTGAETAPIAAFFMDGRLPAPPGQRPSGPLQSTAEWKAYTGAPSAAADPRRALAAVRRFLTPEDVGELLRALETGAMPADGTGATLSLLSQLALGYDARISPQQEGRLGAALRARCLAPPPSSDGVCSMALRRDWGRLDRAFLESTFERRLQETRLRDRDLWGVLTETRERADPASWTRLLDETMRTELAQGHGAGDVILYWLEADAAGAERSVLQLSPRELKPEARVWLANALMSVALVRDQAEPAGRRLAEIVALGGPAATRARVAREIIGVDAQDRIEAMALKWRESRSVESLGQLYHTYIADLPVGTPFGRWCERLGETGPEASKRPTSFHVAPRDSSATLFIELDEEVRLHAMSFD